MNKREEIYLFEIDKIDFDNIPDGATYIMDNNNKPVAVLMSAKYYKYLEQLMFKLKDKILAQNKTK
jgi:PHD/YefM family antitoxin component YafN of YafNO toxin-antitoxin module